MSRLRLLQSRSVPLLLIEGKIIAKHNKCSFVIDRDIVSKIIVDLLLTPAARTEGGDADEVDNDPADVSNASFSLSSVA